DYAGTSLSPAQKAAEMRPSMPQYNVVEMARRRDSGAGDADGGEGGSRGGLDAHAAAGAAMDLDDAFASPGAAPGTPLTPTALVPERRILALDGCRLDIARKTSAARLQGVLFVDLEVSRGGSPPLVLADLSSRLASWPEPVLLAALGSIDVPSLAASGGLSQEEVDLLSTVASVRPVFSNGLSGVLRGILALNNATGTRISGQEVARPTGSVISLLRDVLILVPQQSLRVLYCILSLLSELPSKDQLSRVAGQLGSFLIHEAEPTTHRVTTDTPAKAVPLSDATVVPGGGAGPGPRDWISSLGELLLAAHRAGPGLWQLPASAARGLDE
ncbi:hypothetical protein HK405_007286, partial [Cladochytrium tenue]